MIPKKNANIFFIINFSFLFKNRIKPKAYCSHYNIKEKNVNRFPTKGNKKRPSENSLFSSIKSLSKP